MTKRAERSEPFELEFRSSAAPHDSRNIDGGGGGLANGMLGGRRHRCTCHRLDRGAVTERPDPPFMIFQLQTLIDEQFAALLRAIEVLNYWRKCRRHSGDKRLQEISAPDCSIALSDVAALRRSLRMISIPRWRKILWAKTARRSDISGRMRSPA